MNATRPLASLSLDLDNKWSYMKTHGDPGWESFPSYLDVVVPRVLEVLRAKDLTITFFLVGQDAALPANRPALRAIAEAGHEVGNHSFHHEPWLHLYAPEEVAAEIERAETIIHEATGQRPVGFRGPGYSFTSIVLNVLVQRGYLYDASSLPSFLGPLARAYYLMKSRLPPAERRRRAALFGKARDGFQPLRPYRWETKSGALLEVPVTTMPIFKVPIHLSYVLYLATFAPGLALAYFRAALALCRATRTPPSILLHPLDFLGAEDCPELSFFPAMGMPTDRKLALADRALDIFRASFQVVPIRQFAEATLAHAAPALKRLPATTHF